MNNVIIIIGILAIIYITGLIRSYITFERFKKRLKELRKEKK